MTNPSGSILPLLCGLAMGAMLVPGPPARAQTVGDNLRTGFFATGVAGEVLVDALAIIPGAVVLGLNASEVAQGFRTDPTIRVAGGVIGAVALGVGAPMLAFGVSDHSSGLGKSYIVTGALAAAVGAVDIGLAIAGALLPPRPGPLFPKVTAVPVRGGAVVGISGRF